MRHVYLGSAGLKVSELCLGTMTFGRETEEPEAMAILDAFAAAGGTFIDTGNVYADGVSEEIIGRWLAGRDDHDRFVVATKLSMPVGDGPNEGGLSRVHVRREVERSLRRLGSDHLDLLLIHSWDPGTSVEEAARTLDDLVRGGTVRYLGACNLAGWHIERFLSVAEQAGIEPVRVIQSQYNLLTRGIEWEVLPVARDRGLGVMTWSPLAGSWLTGKHSAAGPDAESRVSWIPSEYADSWDNRANAATWEILAAVGGVAEQRGVPMAQVALNWLRAQPGTMLPILGGRVAGQLTDNLGCLDWDLSAAEVDLLTAASEPEWVYPYEYIRRRTAQRGR